jgi:hypothetical protein
MISRLQCLNVVNYFATLSDKVRKKFSAYTLVFYEPFTPVK